MVKNLYKFSKTLAPCRECPPPDILSHAELNCKNLCKVGERTSRGTNEVRDEQT